MMKINEYFFKHYLTVGRTYDNFLFENCPAEFISVAKDNLSKRGSAVKPCCVTVTRDIEEFIEKTLNNCSEDFQKKLLARDFIMALIMKELLSYTDKKSEYNLVCQQINAFFKNDFERVKDFHFSSFQPSDVKKCMKFLGKIEINFFLEDTKNVYLQQAINIFLSCREPYSVKVFTTNEKLPTYYDPNGNLIECPHDFMRKDVNQFITKDYEDEIIQE